MKEKIIQEVCDKLRKGFEIDFLPRKTFEQEFASFTKEYTPIFLGALETYNALKKSVKEEEYSQIIKLSSDEYIANNFEDKKPKEPMLAHGSLHYLLRDEGMFFDNKPNTLKKKLSLFKRYDSEQFNELKKEYKKLFSERNNIIIIPFFEYFRKKENVIFLLKEEEKEAPHYKLREFVNEISSIVDEEHSFGEQMKGFDLYSDSPEYSLEFFRKAYEKGYGEYMQLLDTFEKYINLCGENVSGFSIYQVNVGHAYFMNEWNRRRIYQFEIVEDSKEYRFRNKQDDSKIPDGKFINLFMLLNKGMLIKLSVGSTKLFENTQWVIYKDIQKISTVDDSIVEIHFHKHFDPEVIVFDTTESAVKFQSKVNGFREGRKDFERASYKSY